LSVEDPETCDEVAAIEAIPCRRCTSPGHDDLQTALVFLLERYATGGHKPNERGKALLLLEELRDS